MLEVSLFTTNAATALVVLLVPVSVLDVSSGIRGISVFPAQPASTGSLSPVPTWSQSCGSCTSGPQNPNSAFPAVWRCQHGVSFLLCPWEEKLGSDHHVDHRKVVSRFCVCWAGLQTFPLPQGAVLGLRLQEMWDACGWGAMGELRQGTGRWH